jgi:uncharacterized protein involved in exopolysaccharide biosynthesis
MMELDDYLRSLRRSWWVPVLCAAVAVGAVLLIAPEPTSRSSARVAVGASPDLVGEGARFSAVQSINEQVLNTLADLYGSHATRTRATAGLGVDPDDVAAYTVDTTVGPIANTVTVAVEGPDGATAERMVGAVVDAGNADFTELYDIYRLETIDPPGPATVTGPSRSTEVALAAVGGFALGCLLAFAREWLTMRRRPVAVPALE